MASADDSEEFSVKLLPKVADSLRYEAMQSDVTVTDLINRAITLYVRLEDERRGGGQLLLRHGDGRVDVVSWGNSVVRHDHGPDDPCPGDCPVT